MRINSTPLRMVLAVVCFGMALLSVSGLLSSSVGTLGIDVLQERNERYLEDTFEKALVGFGVMSGLKAGLAVVEGSTGGVSAGVSLNLQIGDVVQSAYDYVDIAWRTLMLGCISLLSIQYMLDAVSLLDAFILALFFGVLGVSFLWKKRPRLLRDSLLLSFFGVLVVYLLLPLSIFSASLLSERITQPSIDAAQQGFEETGAQLFPEDDELPEGVMARIKQIPERLEQITTYLKLRSSQMALWTIQLIAGYLFDCIFFPLGSFLILLWGTRMLMRYCFQCSLHAALHRELKELKSSQE
ncbi:hypothetical protein P3T73_08205 [Kiritimatiellota bacterium B12222]|nr:hypothetical protein P3T73_08205 [Kiritimatiellota bacterium B12222]